MNEQVQGTVEAAVASISSKAPAAGSVVTVGGWATGSDFGMWVGIVIGVLGLLVNTYYKRKSDTRDELAHRRAEEAHRLAKEAHDAEMEVLRSRASQLDIEESLK